MSRKINYNINWLKGIYNKQIGITSWLPTAKPGYRNYDLLCDEHTPLQVKSNATIAQLRDYYRTFRERMTEELKASFWGKLRKALRVNSFIVNDKNGRRLLEAMGNIIDSVDYLDGNVISVLNKIMDKAFASSEENNIRAFDEAMEIINAQFALLPPIALVKRPNYEGKWVETDDESWPRFDRHQNKYIKSSKEFMSTTEMNYGPEEEGTFPNEVQFNLACEKLSRTPFKGGFMYDKRNLCVPTNDPTIHNGYSVEWTFAPMSYENAIEFQTKFLEIIKEFGWDGEYSRHGSGTHVHIDANKFNDKTLLNFINNVYDRTHDELFAYCGQLSTYNTWNKSDSYRTDSQWYELKGQFTQDGEQLGYCKKIIRSAGRSTLVNLQNVSRTSEGKFKHTVECRGFNGSKDICKILKEIKEIYERSCL